MKKFMFIFVIVLVVGVLTTVIVNSYVKNNSAEKVFSHEILDSEDAELVTEKQVYDVVIILGARVHSEDVVSSVLGDRLKTGYEVYAKGLAKKIIVSGDHGTEEYDEVLAMKKYLMNQGVPREDIFMDHAGFDTYDSMYRAKNVFCVESAIVVTQEYHLSRALYIGNAIGIESVGVSSDLQEYEHMDNYLVREFFARNKAFFDTAIVQRSSKFLGETIPVQSASGIETEDEKAQSVFSQF